MDIVSSVVGNLPEQHAWLLPGIHVLTQTQDQRRSLNSYLGASERCQDFRTHLSHDGEAKIDHAHALLRGPERDHLAKRSSVLRWLGPLPLIFPACSEVLEGSLELAESKHPKAMYRLYVVADGVARISLIVLSISLFAAATEQVSRWLPKRTRTLASSLLDARRVAIALCVAGISLATLSCLDQLLSEGEPRESPHASPMRKATKLVYQLVRHSPLVLADVLALVAFRRLTTVAKMYAIWRGLYRSYQACALFLPEKPCYPPKVQLRTSQEAEHYCALRRLQYKLSDPSLLQEALEGLADLAGQSDLSDQVRIRAVHSKDSTILKQLARGNEVDEALLSEQSRMWVTHVSPDLFRYLRDENGSAGTLLAAAELSPTPCRDLPQPVFDALTPDACREILRAKKAIVSNPLEERDYHRALATGRNSWRESALSVSCLFDLLQRPAESFRTYMPWGSVEAFTLEEYTELHTRFNR